MQLKSLRNKAKTRLPLYNSHVDSTVLGAACITQSSQTWLVSEVQELQCPLTSLTLPTKVHLVKPMVFPVVMYGCESWTIKKAEHRRIDAFELWCWRILLRVPWTARGSNQSILKDINPEYSLEGLKLKLNGKDPDAEKGWRQKEKGLERGWDG